MKAASNIKTDEVYQYSHLHQLVRYAWLPANAEYQWDFKKFYIMEMQQNLVRSIL